MRIWREEGWEGGVGLERWCRQVGWGADMRRKQVKSVCWRPLADATPCSHQACRLTRSPMDPRLVYLAALVYRLSRMPQMREGSPSTVAGAPSKSGGSSTTPRCSGVGGGEMGWVGEQGWRGRM